MLKEITKQEALWKVAENETIYMIRDFGVAAPDPEEMTIINLTGEINDYLEGNDNRFLVDAEPAGPKENFKEGNEGQEEPDADPSEQEEEQEEVDEEPEKTESADKKQKLDIGKIAALHNAGWKQAAIAEEMGVAQSTICRVLAGLK